MRSSAGSILAAGALSTVGAASYFARRVLTPDRQRPDDTQILAVDDDSVTLGVSPDTAPPGRYGLWLDGDRGHARVGEVLESTRDRGRVRRELLGVDFGHLAGGFGRWNQYYFAEPAGPVAGSAHRVRRRARPSSARCRPGWCRQRRSPTGGRSSSTAAVRGATRGCGR